MTALDREPTFEHGTPVAFIDANHRLHTGARVVKQWVDHLGVVRVEVVYKGALGQPLICSPHIERVAFEEGN